MKVAVFLLALIAVAAARSAYQFSAGYLDILGAEPSQTFSCEGRPYGYYADVANDCQVFHVCLPLADEIGAVIETAHFSFICGNQTFFNQETLTCSHAEEALPCTEAEGLYERSNADFGRIPNDITNGVGAINGAPVEIVEPVERSEPFDILQSIDFVDPLQTSEPVEFEERLETLEPLEFVGPLQDDLEYVEDIEDVLAAE
ncbi:hypothetical protein SK128_013278 [Halocaridina rubra]|uniref:Chitin-binding type-2 domain-containing protein n=1 Tax=Halocaridina rubra TaxID=373956 RepID=A0AAN8X4J6_HALRR